MSDQQPIWLTHAWSELGVREATGSSDNPRVVAYYRDAGHSEVKSDAVPWCAAFVGACLARARLSPTGSLMARSYEAWGRAASDDRIGSIAVFERGDDPSLGHVGFVVGASSTDLIVLGGNQSDAVTVEAFSRSRLVALRWPTDGPTVTTPSPVATAFDRILAHVLEMEGGYTDDPYDPGGPTNLGITLATYAASLRTPLNDATRRDLIDGLRNLDKAAAREIYQTRYWLTSNAHRLPTALAAMHFDAAVNHGVTGAARMLQEALSVEADGEIGPITLSAARKRPLSETLSRYAAIRLRIYQSLPHFWRFGRGWTRRVDDTKRLALSLINEPSPPLSDNNTKERPMSEQSDTTDPKWWGNSMTIWGAIVTGLTNVLPVIGPLIGIDITSEMIRDLGQNLTQAIQAIGGIIGIFLTVFGRMRAIQPLTRRDFKLKV